METSKSLNSLKRESTITNTGCNLECVTFVWLDLRRETSSVFINALRAINDCVRIYTDTTVCLDSIESSNDRIFLISSSSNSEVLSKANALRAVEAIFVFDPDMSAIRGDFAKLINVFAQQEELLRALKGTLEIFEHIRLEEFTFQSEKIFPWWQLWKEETKNQKPRNSGKSTLVELARNYYRGNTKQLKFVDEFDKLYKPKDSLRWCVQSSFPAQFLKRVFLSPTSQSISSYQFLVSNSSRALESQPKRPSRRQVYRGMKLSNALLDTFAAHSNQLVSVNGFFVCTELRNVELESAQSPSYRTDLTPVLFKVDVDASARLTDLIMDNKSSTVVFDVATCFRIMCVSRDTTSIIRMKTDADEGKKLGLEYREVNKDKTIEVLLDELLLPPKPTPVLDTATRNVEVVNDNDQISKDELEAETHLRNKDIDQAIKAYRRIRPISARILKLIGRLFAEEKHDYSTATDYYSKALEMEEKAGEDISDTLLRLGELYQRRKENDLAVKHYFRALSLLESGDSSDSKVIASTLTNVATIRQIQGELNEALDYAQRAWTLYESSNTDSETFIATSLVLLASIHHGLGDDSQALKLGLRALTLFDRNQLSDSNQAATLFETLGLIQMNLGELTEAEHYFQRSIKIYSASLPSKQEELAKAEKNLQCVLEMQYNTDKFQHYS